MDGTAGTLYDWVGGDEMITSIVNHFYPKVMTHPDLAPIFPEDITETMKKQRMFLTQFLGGPPLYSEVYGHPMLRARHLPFEVTPKRAQAWLACMQEAMDEAGLTGDARDVFYGRLRDTAAHMVNTPDEH
ncbi:MAG: globin [Bacilli bacterium]|nr:globin [Bacilli bacterium]